MDTSGIDEGRYSRAWWKEAIVYQVYPSSFCDSNKDGIGDLNGISSKLDYLAELGINVIWISPIYKSPQKDMGYDISDYRDIDPRYGSLEDWDHLVKGMHERGLKLMMDLVVNHTSDEHDWFKESRASKSSPKRDWYIWRPAKYDERGRRRPPNNWKSHLQGSVWEWDEKTQEYYFHLYLPGQPDLNWENTAVRSEVRELMRFWFDRGCDGFRMDVINFISKTPGLPDAPVVDPNEEYQPAPMYYANGPRVHEYLQEMNNEVLSEYEGVMTVGQASYTHDTRIIAHYVLPKYNELNMVFQFEVMELDAPGKTRNDSLQYRKWKLPELREVITRWQTLLVDEGFWNTIFLSNHDTAREVSRFALYIYQGEEIGMANAPRSWPIEEYKDVATQRIYNRFLNERRKKQGIENPDMKDVMDGVQKKARDHARLPMQWNATENAGFSEATPWMRVNDDYKEWNVAAQETDESSVLVFWKKLIQMRKKYDVLIYGDFQLLGEDDECIFAFQRILGGSTALVLLNFSENDASFTLPTSRSVVYDIRFHLLISNYGCTPRQLDACFGSTVHLKGYEGRAYLRQL